MNNILMLAILAGASCFLGFAMGRIGDLLFGDLDFLHHWTYPIPLWIISWMYRSEWWAIPLATFGIGLFVSDLDDFLHLRVWGPDEEHEWRFWSIK